jgi:hypothetical protein
VGEPFLSVNVFGVIDVTQAEIHTAEPLEPEPGAFEVELAIEKLKSHKSPVIVQTPTELRQGIEQLALRSINVLLLFGIRRKFLRSARSRSLYLCIRRTIKSFVLIIEAYHFCELRAKFYPSSSCQG